MLFSVFNSTAFQYYPRAGFPARKTKSSLRGSTTTTVRLSAYDVIMQMVYCHIRRSSRRCNPCRFQGGSGKPDCRGSPCVQYTHALHTLLPCRFANKRTRFRNNTSSHPSCTPGGTYHNTDQRGSDCAGCTSAWGDSFHHSSKTHRSSNNCRTEPERATKKPQ